MLLCVVLTPLVSVLLAFAHDFILPTKINLRLPSFDPNNYVYHTVAMVLLVHYNNNLQSICHIVCLIFG